MTAVISGWRWAVLDAPEPVWGQVALGVGVARDPLRRRARGVPLGRAALRGHDLMTTVITAEGLSKRYRLGEHQAAYGTLRESLAHAGSSPHADASTATRRTRSGRCDDVSFEVQQGEVLGVIGRNGAGKSTLLKILTRITTPTAGRVEIRGRVGSLLEVGTGFHPELTGRENVYLNGAILGMKRREIDRRYDAIVEFSGVEQFIDTPVKRYSSGMYVRLAFAVAAHLEPEILLVDEVLAVGDAEFQRRCLGRMEELGSSGRTVLFVSHQLPAVAQLCDRAIQINGGRVVGDGPPADVIANYLHQTHSSGSERTWTDESAPGDDLARILVGSPAPARRDAAGRRRRPQPGRNRGRVQGAPRRQARLPEDQGSGSGRRDRLQRDGHGRAVAEPDARRASTSRQRGSRRIS